MTSAPQKLLLAFIQTEDAPVLLRRFRDAGLAVTSLESAGGFLRRRNLTLLAALATPDIPHALDIIREVCRARTERVDTLFGSGTVEGVVLPSATDIPVGGATVLLLDITDVVKV